MFHHYYSWPSTHHLGEKNAGEAVWWAFKPQELVLCQEAAQSLNRNDEIQLIKDIKAHII